jgi:hypothetical protein
VGEHLLFTSRVVKRKSGKIRRNSTFCGGMARLQDGE